MSWDREISKFCFNSNWDENSVFQLFIKQSIQISFLVSKNVSNFSKWNNFDVFAKQKFWNISFWKVSFIFAWESIHFLLPFVCQIFHRIGYFPIERFDKLHDLIKMSCWKFVPPASRPVWQWIWANVFACVLSLVHCTFLYSHFSVYSTPDNCLEHRCMCAWVLKIRAQWYLFEITGCS